ncbi:ionotropic receptor 21a [Diorhabda carinulata]|uniref:ionotropic receptor 21a n=1 Tax=Diorhabda carinulata TaxID=1163345 RepID=UPI0025A1C1D3|nr:ionotropic receptor 21a [Diorhabda carinulata]
MCIAYCYIILIVFAIIPSSECLDKRALQSSHEKTQPEKWAEMFLNKKQPEKRLDLVMLLKKITFQYLSDCTPIILFDSFTVKNDNLFLEKLLNNFPLAYINGRIMDDYNIKLHVSYERMQPTCFSYLLFMEDVMKSTRVIGEQTKSKVVVIARSSQWRVIDFLSHEESRYLVNLLIIVKSEDFRAAGEENAYILYTHKLYVDALASSNPVVLSSYQAAHFTRNVDLFPKKLSNGFSGHRFIVSMSNQPPYVISKGLRTSDGEKIFEGIEIRLVNLLSKLYNFTTDYREATEDTQVGSSEAVTNTIENNKANIGIGGIYVTPDKIRRMGLSSWHSRDCAAFISLASTALPRYRAILGPFKWTVWLTLIFIYLGGIFPLTFSDKLTLKYLLKNPEEVENMFWYVFGTFTNCFTFTGKGSWSKAEKFTTKLLIAFYWLFTIIITACYTGSIIAFVTLPVYPSVIDTARQLMSGWYQIGILDKGEWQYLFLNSTDELSIKLMENIDLVPTIEEGLKNTTKYSLWKYAFLGSRAQLDYIVRTNLTTKSKRSVMHISKECFIPFSVSIAYPLNSVYGDTISRGIELIKESGIMSKIKNDVEWEMMRSATGKLLSASSSGNLKTLSYEDRALNLEDTQGMFLLLAIGSVIGVVALIFEWFGGCYKICRRRTRRGSDESIESNPRIHERQTSKANYYYQRYTVLKDSFEENKKSRINDETFQSFERLKIDEEYGISNNGDEYKKYDETIDNMIDDIFDNALKHHIALPETKGHSA